MIEYGVLGYFRIYLPLGGCNTSFGGFGGFGSTRPLQESEKTTPEKPTDISEEDS